MLRESGKVKTQRAISVAVLDVDGGIDELASGEC
jgi:hypothetical protein